MSTHTYQARLCAGLEALGYHKDITRSGKYIAYTRANMQGFFFVGKAGALRKGRCATQSGSIGMPGHETPAYKMVLEAGDKRLATVQPTSMAERLSTLD